MEDTTLNVKDIAQALNLIDVAASRAAFKPEEFSTVGATRDKIIAFLQAMQAQQQAQSAEETTAPAPVNEEEASNNE